VFSPRGVIAIGGGKGGDDVTAFWDAIAAGTGVSVTYVNGAANISAQSFANFALIAVVSSEDETPSGGLTAAGSSCWSSWRRGRRPLLSRRAQPEDYPPAGPILSDGVIFLTARSRTNESAEAHKRLYAVDPASGKTKWVTTIAVDASDWDLTTAPATAKGLVFLAVSDPHQHSGQSASPDGAALYAISADDGQIKWKLSAQRTFDCRTETRDSFLTVSAKKRDPDSRTN
jgi:outer membrane protein assembly factor BamB